MGASIYLVPIALASIDDLIALKQAVGRSIDLADIEPITSTMNACALFVRYRPRKNRIGWRNWQHASD